MIMRRIIKNTRKGACRMSSAGSPVTQRSALDYFIHPYDAIANRPGYGNRILAVASAVITAITLGVSYLAVKGGYWAYHQVTRAPYPLPPPEAQVDSAGQDVFQPRSEGLGKPSAVPQPAHKVAPEETVQRMLTASLSLDRCRTLLEIQDDLYSSEYDYAERCRNAVSFIKQLKIELGKISSVENPEVRNEIVAQVIKDMVQPSARFPDPHHIELASREAAKSANEMLIRLWGEVNKLLQEELSPSPPRIDRRPAPQTVDALAPLQSQRLENWIGVLSDWCQGSPTKDARFNQACSAYLEPLRQLKQKLDDFSQLDAEAKRRALVEITTSLHKMRFDQFPAPQGDAEYEPLSCAMRALWNVLGEMHEQLLDAKPLEAS
jgi:hypothetical protein